MASEFPKTLYRYDDEGERIGKTFSDADAVEPGWICIDDLGPAPAKKPQAMAGKEAGEAAKRLVAAEGENARLKDTVKLYEDFVSRMRDDPSCPEPMQKAIAELLGEKRAEPVKQKVGAKK